MCLKRLLRVQMIGPERLLKGVDYMQVYCLHLECRLYLGLESIRKDVSLESTSRMQILRLLCLLTTYRILRVLNISVDVYGTDLGYLQITDLAGRKLLNKDHKCNSRLLIFCVSIRNILTKDLKILRVYVNFRLQILRVYVYFIPKILRACVAFILKILRVCVVFTLKILHVR